MCVHRYFYTITCFKVMEKCSGQLILSALCSQHAVAVITATKSCSKNSVSVNSIHDNKIQLLKISSMCIS